MCFNQNIFYKEIDSSSEIYYSKHDNFYFLSPLNHISVPTSLPPTQPTILGQNLVKKKTLSKYPVIVPDFFLHFFWEYC